MRGDGSAAGQWWRPRSSFLTAIRLYCEGIETVAIGCAGPECEYAEGDPDHSCETSFSWAQCDSCGSTFGGDRSPAFGLYRDDSGKLQSIAMEVCTDCVMWHANGDEPEQWSQSPGSNANPDMPGVHCSHGVLVTDHCPDCAAPGYLGGNP